MIPRTGVDSYIDMLFSLPHMTPMAVFSLFFLGIFRLAPIVSFAPFLGSKLPAGVKMGLVISLTFVLLPQIALHTTETLDFNLNFVGYALKELLIGFVIAILISIPFYIAESAGSMIDFMRGASSLQVTDPTTQTQTSPIGILFNSVLIVIFFEINGPFLFFDALANSYELIPADQIIQTSLFAAKQPFWKFTFGITARVVAVSAQLAAPCLVSILMAEMFLGIANRLAPQVQIAFLGMSLKSLLGLGLLYAGWYFILQQMGKESLNWLKELNKALLWFRV